MEKPIVKKSIYVLTGIVAAALAVFCCALSSAPLSSPFSSDAARYAFPVYFGGQILDLALLFSTDLYMRKRFGDRTGLHNAVTISAAGILALATTVIVLLTGSIVRGSAGVAFFSWGTFIGTPIGVVLAGGILCVRQIVCPNAG